MSYSQKGLMIVCSLSVMFSLGCKEMEFDGEGKDSAMKTSSSSAPPAVVPPAGTKQPDSKNPSIPTPTPTPRPPIADKEKLPSDLNKVEYLHAEAFEKIFSSELSRISIDIRTAQMSVRSTKLITIIPFNCNVDSNLTDAEVQKFIMLYDNLRHCSSKNESARFELAVEILSVARQNNMTEKFIKRNIGRYQDTSRYVCEGAEQFFSNIRVLLQKYVVDAGKCRVLGKDVILGNFDL